MGWMVWGGGIGFALMMAIKDGSGTDLLRIGEGLLFRSGNGQLPITPVNGSMQSNAPHDKSLQSQLSSHADVKHAH